MKVCEGCIVSAGCTVLCAKGYIELASIKGIEAGERVYKNFGEKCGKPK